MKKNDLNIDENSAISFLFEGFFQQRFQNEEHEGLNKDKLKEIYLKSIELVKKSNTMVSDSLDNSIAEYATILDFAFGEYRFAPNKSVDDIANTVFDSRSCGYDKSDFQSVCGALRQHIQNVYRLVCAEYTCRFKIVYTSLRMVWSMAEYGIFFDYISCRPRRHFARFARSGADRRRFKV